MAAEALTGPTRPWPFRWWARFAEKVSWTAPTSTEIGLVMKAGIAAGIAWVVADLVTDVANPVLAPLAALVTVRVSVRSSISRAVLRSAAVVLGVLLALAIGDALSLNGLTVGLLVAGSLAVAELVLRLPTWAATQMPVSVLVVLAAVTGAEQASAWWRAVDTVIGAAVGVAVSLAFPASRVVDARQTLHRLGDGIAETLDGMANGLTHPWSRDETERWRQDARTTRARLVTQAAEAVGDSREAARWNHRDRRHLDELQHFEDLFPRAERVALGVSSIARTLDEFAHQSDEMHPPMPKLSALLRSLASAVRAVDRAEVDGAADADVDGALTDVAARRAECTRSAIRRAQLAVEQEGPLDRAGGEWLGYAALLVHVDRIASDLKGPPGASSASQW